MAEELEPEELEDQEHEEDELDAAAARARRRPGRRRFDLWALLTGGVNLLRRIRRLTRRRVG